MPCANVKRSDISTIRHSTRFHFLVLHNKVLWTFRALCSFGFVSRLLELGGDYVNGSKLLLQFTFFPVSLVNDNQVEWHTTRYHTPQHEPAQGRESHYAIIWQFFLCSVQFSCSVVSDSLQPHESQYARPPCPSPTPRVHSDSHPSSQWCHSAISSSVIPFPPAANLSQDQSLFQWVSSSHEVAKLL